ncbi:MAG TPA: acetyl-CoA carboxylase biotin carboxyl carrier protein [Acidobacteriaceae bacterium]|jgi:acetyl-CoA carboxylase biotin carboxyl carrier protein|nr:acetyl-CoA carboxylase biotin carboxyl carrier protein [Acidobacteriaceae bacterium]
MSGEDLQELRELVEFLKANGVAEFDMEREDLKVRLKFAGAAGDLSGVDVGQLAKMIAAQTPTQVMPSLVMAAPAQAAVPVASEAAAVAAPVASAAPAAASAPEDGAHVVKSPIVGTFYDAPSPEAEPFVKVGERVSSGQVLCIVEAMKLMNEIEADASGEIVKVFVKPGQPVEYGQPLFAIK